MNTRAPSRARIVAMVLFAASCVGLLLFLWISFGGSVPFTAQGYRLTVEFDQAVQLGTQADVEISGVTVGKVVGVGLDRQTGLTRAVLQIYPRFAPRPADTRAILRQKTLLGETYVELSFGDASGAKLADGARLPQAQVAPTVQLDQILNTFDPTTRRAFETWMQQDGIAFTNRGEDFNSALAELYPFATNVTNVLTVLRRDRAATSALLSDGAGVLSAISSSPAALQGLIRNSNAVFAATAARSTDLAAAIRDFPAFLQSTRQTISNVRGFAADTKPLIDELQPAAQQLTPALQAIATVSPDLKTLMTGLGPLNRASAKGIPAVQGFLSTTASASSGASKPVLSALTPYLGQLVPVIDYVNAFRGELAAFFANSAAATQGVSPGITSSALHYLRISAPVGPDTLTGYSHRLLSNRGNAYMDPGSSSTTTSGYMTIKNRSLGNALQSFGSYLCTANAVPTLSAALKASLPSTLYRLVHDVYYGYGYPSVPHPVCNQQTPLGRATGISSNFYPRLQPLP